MAAYALKHGIVCFHTVEIAQGDFAVESLPAISGNSLFTNFTHPGQHDVNIGSPDLSLIHI